MIDLPRLKKIKVSNPAKYVELLPYIAIDFAAITVRGLIPKYRFKKINFFLDNIIRDSDNEITNISNQPIRLSRLLAGEIIFSIGNKIVKTIKAKGGEV